MTVRISALAVLVLGCAATPPRPSPPADPMTPPTRPADTTPTDPLTLELAAQGYRVAFTTDGGEPSLRFTGGQLRGYALTGRTADAAALELRFGEKLERRPFLAEGLAIALGVSVHIIALHADGEREWFSVIESPPASADPSVAAPPWRVRLFERSGGRGKLLASHDSYAHMDRKQTRSLYEQNGEVVIVGFGGSLYAVARGSLLVLDGPGADAARFMETSDPDCPPNKRCYMLPAEIDVKRFIGEAPSGRSLVMAGEGDILRRDTATGATIGFGYNNFFYTGLVEEDAVVLAHAGEPPFVKRWSPAAQTRPSPPHAVGRPTPVQVQPGVEQLLVEGPIYVQLARTTDGTLYGVTREGSLDRIADGRANPVVRLPPGHRVVSVAAADTLAFVVASDTTPPVHAIVIPNRG